MESGITLIGWTLDKMDPHRGQDERTKAVSRRVGREGRPGVETQEILG